MMPSSVLSSCGATVFRCLVALVLSSGCTGTALSPLPDCSKSEFFVSGATLDTASAQTNVFGVRDPAKDIFVMRRTSSVAWSVGRGGSQIPWRKKGDWWVASLKLNTSKVRVIDVDKRCVVFRLHARRAESVVEKPPVFVKAMKESEGSGRYARTAWLRAAKVAAGREDKRLQGVFLRNAANRELRSRELRSARCLLAHARKVEHELGYAFGFLVNELYRGMIERTSSHLVSSLERLETASELAASIQEEGLENTILIHAAEAAMDLGELSQARSNLERATMRLGLSQNSSESAWAASMLTAFELKTLELSDTSIDAKLTLRRSLRSAEYYRAENDIDNLTNQIVNQARLHLELGNLDETDALLDELERLDPERERFSAAFAGTVRGWLALERGQPEEAEEIFRRTYREARTKAGGASETTWPARWGIAAAKRAQRDLGGAAEQYLGAFNEMLTLAVRSGGQVETILGGKRRFLDDVVLGLLDVGQEREAFEVAAILSWLALGGKRLENPEGSRPPRIDDQEWPSDPMDCLSLRTEMPRAEQQTPTGRLRDDLRALKLKSDEAFVLVIEQAGRGKVFILKGKRTNEKANRAPARRPKHQAPSGSQTPSSLHSTRLITRPFDPDHPVEWTEALRGVRHVYLSSPLARNRGELALAEGASLLTTERTLTLIPHPGLLRRRPAEVPEGSRVAMFGSGANLSTSEKERALALDMGLSLREGESVSSPRSLGPLDVFFFSGHGELETGSLWSSRLYFAPDRPVPLVQWLEAQLPIRLAILSACSTASPTIGPTGHWFGFAEGLLMSGADTVLAARGEVTATAALRFVERFLESGGLEHPARAYRDTLLRLRELGDTAWDKFLLFGRRGQSSGDA